MEKKKILVIAESYPNPQGGVELMYIHTRNLFYAESGIQVTVLNFRAKEDYIIDGIRVISKKTYYRAPNSYDVLVLHAANLKNHIRFLCKYGKNFKKYLFFFHGHEVMRINYDYAKPYPYIKTSKIKKVIQNVYDSIKLWVWRNLIPRVLNKSFFVFVSNWMYEMFMKNVRINPQLLKGKTSITYNNVGREFEKLQYNDELKHHYDFITIRAKLDGAKYAIDIVNQLAHNSPKSKFLVIGKGDYFKYNEKAKNIEWRDTTLSHEEIISVLQDSKFALMPTRTDAQGLMMCEMAAFGIPIITSNIPVCHEVFDGFQNVYFLDNNDKKYSLDIFKDVNSFCNKDTRFYIENTVKRELEVIENLIG